MEKQKQKKSLGDVIVNTGTTVFSKLVRFFTSKKVVIVNGSLSIAMLYLLVHCFVHPTAFLYATNFDGGQEYNSFRSQVLSTGTPGYKSNTAGTPIDPETMTSTKVDLDGQTYTVAVGNQPVTSRCFEIQYTTISDDHGFFVALRDVNQIIALAENKNSLQAQPACQLEIYLTDSNGDIKLINVKTETGQEVATQIGALGFVGDDLTLTQLDLRYEQNTDPYASNQEKVKADFLAEGQAAMTKAKNVLAHFGVHDTAQWQANLKDYQNYIYTALLLPVLGAGLGLFFVPFIAFTIFCSVYYFAKEKEKRLRASGVDMEVAAQPPQTMGKPQGPRGRKFDEFIREKGLKPIFGEWFFRGAGLILILIANVFFFIAERSSTGAWGAGWAAFSTGASGIFRAGSEIGTFILVISVVQIVAETKRNLHVSSIVFLALSIVYYLLLCGVLYFLDLFLEIPESFLTTEITPRLPGNLFLGIGIFAFLGFFLFTDPPEWLINRKVFRGLSILPLALAVASTANSIVVKLTQTGPSYWISNFLFIRDFAAVFVGISFEFVIFFLERRARKQFGSEKSMTPTQKKGLQFRKNIGLCILVLIYVLIFYLTPSYIHDLLELNLKHTFLYLTIPFFLFYKPAGEKHKLGLDILYYALYIIALQAPRILQIGISLFSS